MRVKQIVAFFVVLILLVNVWVKMPDKEVWAEEKQYSDETVFVPVGEDDEKEKESEEEKEAKKYSPGEPVRKAKAGPHCTWSLDRKGTMTIEGTGNVVLNSVLYKERQESIKRIIVSKGITGIDAYAFFGCENVTRVTLPNTVRVIGQACFQNCYSLKAVELKNGLKTIYSAAFSRCYNLKKLVIPDSVTHVDKNAIRDCRSLKTVVLPQKLKKFGENFTNCLSLRAIVNRSSKRIPLDPVSEKRVWKANGKKTDVLEPGKKAKTRGLRCRITYDLRGGKTTDPMPKYHYCGDKLKLPRAEKKGYTFLGWRCESYFTYGDSFVRYYGKDIKLAAYFVKHEVENLEGGKIKVRITDDDFEWHKVMRREGFFPLDYVVRISENKDMSNYRLKFWSEHDDKGKYVEGICEGFEVGKTYYVQFSYYYTTGDDNKGEELDRLPKWFMKQSITIEK
ncbi:MAG: leucine-rich repeat protein [Roseburia sp.]|nr:leucine-rich repeat protein [Roseburia sp.]